MALFQGTERINGSRSHTKLVVSGHDSPAQDWLIDPTFMDATMKAAFDEGVLFHYDYGGPGMEDVVIPMGRVVGVAAPVKDFTQGVYKTTLSLPGIATDNNTVGVAPYNFCKDYFQQDRFGGNKPSIITTNYLSLPYIPSVEPASSFDKAGLLDEEKRISKDLKMPWGAVIGAGVKEGCYLKSTPSGRFTKWEKGTDDFVDVVGQVLATDFNSEPFGWEKWMLWDPSVRHEDDMYINRSGSSDLPSDAGYPFSPEYAEGNTVFQSYQSQTVNNPTGIPGLHDGSGNFTGFGKNDTEYKDIDLGKVPTIKVDDTIIVINAKDYAGGNLKNLQEDSVEIKVNGSKVTDGISIDYEAGTISFPVKTAQSGQAITGSYKAFHYGTPTYLDFKGVVGAVFVLLKK